MMEKFSVLMSVYFREKPAFLREALRSVFEQSVLPAEVVVVKDGPLGDELDSVVAEFDVKVVALPENVGLGNALNEGLKHCSYELVARMDSDDICRSDRFEKQLKVFEQNPGLGVVGSWVEEFSTDPSKIEGRRVLPTEHKDILRFAKSKCPINHPSVMYCKKLINYIDFWYLEDYYLWGRLLSEGVLFANISECLVLMRTGDGMFARRGGWKYAKSEIKLQREFLRLGLIGYFDFIKNVAIRFTVRIIPNKMRTFVYKKLLRK